MTDATPQQGWLHDRLLLGLMVLLLWLPIPIGSNRGPFWTVAELWLALLLVIWLVQFLRNKRQLPTAFLRAWPLYLPLALWCLLVFLQTVPLPAAWVEAISPKAAWLHQLAFDPTGGTRWLTLSVDPHSTRIGLHKGIAYLLIVVVTLLLVDNGTRLQRLVYVLVAAGLVQTALAFFEIWTRGGQSAWRVTAGFANPNHLANYLTLCTAVGLGLMLASMRSRSAKNARESLRRALDWLMSGKMRLRFALLLMATVIVLTRSRMGIVAFFGGMFIAGTLALLLSRQRKRGLVILLTSMAIIDVAIVGSIFGVEQVAQRLEDTSLVAEQRDEVARDTLAYWREHPLVGSGLGSFYVTYPRYKQGDVASFFRQAHNDYLQLGAETGLLGLLLVAAAVSATLIAAIRALRTRRNALSLGMAFGVLMAVFAVMIHATVEFNLQIFANAGTLATILAMGWVALYLPRGGTGMATGAARTRRSAVVATLALALVGVFGYQVLRTAGSDAITKQNTRLLERWTLGHPVRAAQLDGAMRQQIEAIGLSPHNPNAKLLLSRLAWWQLQAVTPSADGQPAKNRGAVYDQMLYALLAAARDNPGLANTWVAIATVKHFQRQYDAMFQAALSRTAQLAPWEPHVQRDVARIGLAAWDDITAPAQRQAIAESIQRGLSLDAEPMRALIERSGRRDQLCAGHADLLPDFSCPQTGRN